jgi:hypothetical protein
VRRSALRLVFGGEKRLRYTEPEGRRDE